MKSNKEIDEMHRVWYSFCDKFASGAMGDSFDDLVGCDVMEEVEEWAKDFPEVKITRCDDNHHTGSLLVLIPQLTNEKHYFFLYPSQQEALIEALNSIKIEDRYAEQMASLGFKDFIKKKIKMNVKELKEILESLPDDMEVVLQKDSEGNGYSPLAGGDTEAVYIPDSTWSGDVYSTKWSADDACMDDDEWAEILDKPRALILYPIN